MKKICLFLLIVGCNIFSFAQGIDQLLSEKKPIHDKDISKLSALEIYEDSLVYCADSMYTSLTEEQKSDAGIVFIKYMKSYLKLPNSFKYDCKKLDEKISIQTSPNKAFKIYTWQVVPNENNIRYYGVVQMSDGKYFPLIDISPEIIRGGEDTVLYDMKWYGCLYYNIIEKEIQGVPIYFLLGWNGANMNSDKKIIDAFTFDNNNKPVFGAPLFNSIERGKRKLVQRYILEYQKGSRVSMNLDNNIIVLDHCESQIGDPAKKYTYIPDGTYDGFIWDNNKWNMSENVVQMVEQISAPEDKKIK